MNLKVFAYCFYKLIDGFLLYRLTVFRILLRVILLDSVLQLYLLPKGLCIFLFYGFET